MLRTQEDTDQGRRRRLGIEERRNRARKMSKQRS